MAANISRAAADAVHRAGPRGGSAGEAAVLLQDAAATVVTLLEEISGDLANGYLDSALGAGQGSVDGAAETPHAPTGREPVVEPARHLADASEDGGGQVAGVESFTSRKLP